MPARPMHHLHSRSFSNPATCPCSLPWYAGEVKAKFDQTTVDLFAEVFQALPVAVCVDTRALVVHGGLFQQDGVSLEDIAKIDRWVADGDEVVRGSVAASWLWSWPPMEIAAPPRVLSRWLSYPAW